MRIIRWTMFAQGLAGKGGATEERGKLLKYTTAREG